MSRKPDPYKIDDATAPLTQEELKSARPGKMVLDELGLETPHPRKRPQLDSTKTRVSRRGNVESRRKPIKIKNNANSKTETNSQEEKSNQYFTVKNPRNGKASITTRFASTGTGKISLPSKSDSRRAGTTGKRRKIK